MKRGIVLFIIVCFSQYIACRNDSQRDSIMYMAAYSYIVNDSINVNKQIAVADSIIDLDRFWFTNDLTALPMEKEKVKKYRVNKMYTWDVSCYSPLLDSLFHNRYTKQSHTILFFSGISDLMLRADLFFFDAKKMKESDKFRYESYLWGISFAYLFIFNKDGTIRKVLRCEIILN